MSDYLKICGEGVSPEEAETNFDSNYKILEVMSKEDIGHSAKIEYIVNVFMSVEAKSSLSYASNASFEDAIDGLVDEFVLDDFDDMIQNYEIIRFYRR